MASIIANKKSESAVSTPTWAPGVEEHHQSSQGDSFTQGLCRQRVPPHRSVGRWGHGQGHDPSLQVGCLVSTVLPNGLDVTGVHWGRVTKLRTGPMLFWRSRTWWGWWVGLERRWIKTLCQNSYKRLSQCELWGNLPVSTMRASGSWALTGFTISRVRRKDCPRLTISCSVVISMVRWAELLDWQWKSTFLITTTNKTLTCWVTFANLVQLRSQCRSNYWN